MHVPLNLTLQLAKVQNIRKCMPQHTGSPRAVVPLLLQYLGRVCTPSTSSFAARVVSMTATRVRMMFFIGNASLAVQK